MADLPPRKPRKHPGGKLTVLKDGGLWHVWYVATVDANHIAWSFTIPGVTTSSWDRSGFATWSEAMGYAATLRTYYGDQCRGDNLLWERYHGRRVATAATA